MRLVSRTMVYLKELNKKVISQIQQSKLLLISAQMKHTHLKGVSARRVFG